MVETSAGKVVIIYGSPICTGQPYGCLGIYVVIFYSQLLPNTYTKARELLFMNYNPLRWNVFRMPCFHSVLSTFFNSLKQIIWIHSWILQSCTRVGRRHWLMTMFSHRIILCLYCLSILHNNNIWGHETLMFNSVVNLVKTKGGIHMDEYKNSSASLLASGYTRNMCRPSLIDSYHTEFRLVAKSANRITLITKFNQIN